VVVEFRTVEQNRYYFKVISIISNHTGDSKDSTHKDMKDRFLPDKAFFVCEKCGIVPGVEPSTVLLTKDEMTEYINDIKLWAWEFDQITFPEIGD
jgi:hypothetical protein